MLFNKKANGKNPFLLKKCSYILLSSLLLVACGDKVKPLPTDNTSFAPDFYPSDKAIDLTNDLHFGDRFYDGVDNHLPETTATTINNFQSLTLSDLDGFSSSAQFDIQLNHNINPKSIITEGKQQNIFVIPLKSNDPSDTIGLNHYSLDEHKVIDQTKLQAIAFSAKVVNLEQQTNVLRISPLIPLVPNTKYLVILLKSIKDTNGNNLTRSSEYCDDLKSQDLTDPYVYVVHQWQALAEHTLQALNAGEYDKDKDEVAYAYTFTTTRSPEDLVALASPKAALLDQGFSAEKADEKLANSNIDPLAFPQARQVGLIRHGLSFSDLFNPFIKQVSQQLDAIEPSTVAYMLNMPEAEVKQKLSSIKTALSYAGNLDFVASKALGYPSVNFSQGYISLPYFLKAPTLDASGKVSASSLANFDNDQWQDNHANTSTISPYPDKQIHFEKAPFLATVPSSDKPKNGWPVVIFQHGIFGDRSNSLATGIALASLCKKDGKQGQCFATIAMDLPFHGIAPTLDVKGFKIPSPLIGFGMHALRDELTYKIANAKDDLLKNQLQKELTLAQQVHERHFNVTRDNEGDVVPMSWAGFGKAIGNSGSTFMNFTNLISQRDRMRQAISDLLNLNASLKNIDLDGDGQPDLDISKVYFVGHSLGGVIGMPFVAINNDKNVQKLNPNLPKIQAAALLTTGASIPKLIENSPSFRPTITKTFNKMGLSLGSKESEHYLYALQNVIDGADPINFAAKLKNTHTPLYMAEIVGGAPLLDGQGYQKVSNDGEPLYALADQTIPNSSDNHPLKPLKGAIFAPLAGTEPVIRLLGLKPVIGKDGDNGQSFTIANSTNNNSDATLRLVSRFNQGSHITPVVALDNFERLYADNKQLLDYVMHNSLALSDVPALAPYRYLAKDSIERSAGLFLEMANEVNDFFAHNGQQLYVAQPVYLSRTVPKGYKPSNSKIEVNEHTVKVCGVEDSCVIDNQDGAFEKTGNTWKTKNDRNTALNGNYAEAAGFADSATWWFKVKQSGTYNISVRAPSNFAKGIIRSHGATTGALYNVYSSAGESPNHLFNMVQGVNNAVPFNYPLMPDGQYVSIGTYVFNDPSQSYKVTLHNRSAENLLTGPLIADAVKIEYIADDTVMSQRHIDYNQQQYPRASTSIAVHDALASINHLKDSEKFGTYPADAFKTATLELTLIKARLADTDLSQKQLLNYQTQIAQIVKKFKYSFVPKALTCKDSQKTCAGVTPQGTLMSFTDNNFFALPKGNKGTLKTDKYGQLGKNYLYFSDPKTLVGWRFQVAADGKYQININEPGKFEAADGYGSDKAKISLVDETTGKTMAEKSLDLFSQSYALNDTEISNQAISLAYGHTYKVMIAGAYIKNGWFSNTNYGISADAINVKFQG